MRASLTRILAWMIPLLSLSALDLLPEYVGLMSFDISSRTERSWEYLDTCVCAARCAAWFVLVAASNCVVDAEAAEREEMVWVGARVEEAPPPEACACKGSDDLGAGTVGRTMEGGGRGGGVREENVGGGVSQNLLEGGGTAGGVVMLARAAVEKLSPADEEPPKALGMLLSAAWRSRAALAAAEAPLPPP